MVIFVKKVFLNDRFEIYVIEREIEFFFSFSEFVFVFKNIFLEKFGVLESNIMIYEWKKVYVFIKVEVEFKVGVNRVRVVVDLNINEV